MVLFSSLSFVSFPKENRNVFSARHVGPPSAETTCDAFSPELQELLVDSAIHSLSNANRRYSEFIFGIEIFRMCGSMCSRLPFIIVPGIPAAEFFPQKILPFFFFFFFFFFS